MKHPPKPSKYYLFSLSIPIFFSNLAIPLVGLIDTYLMGHLGSSKFLVATSISTSVITMIFWSFGFLRMGTVGLVAQSLGKGDYNDIVLTITRNIFIALFFGFLIFFLKNPILASINYFFEPSSEIQVLITKYISVRLISAPAEFCIYVLIGLFLGLQKTKISSFITIVFCLTNILFSSYFVLELKLGIYGVALGTVVAAYLISAIFLIYSYYFSKKNFNIIPKINKLYVKKKIIKLFNINFDIFIRTFFITFAFLWFTYLSSKLGEDYLAINTILLQFILIASFILDAYAHTTEGVIGFSIGRNIKNSFLFTVYNSFKLSFYTALIISLFYLFFSKNLINVLTDLEYIRFLSYGYIFWIILIPLFGSLCYQFDGIFIGASQTREMRNSMIFSALLFIFISNNLIKIYDNHGLWFSLLLFMVLRTLTLKFYFPNIIKKF